MDWNWETPSVVCFVAIGYLNLDLKQLNPKERFVEYTQIEQINRCQVPIKLLIQSLNINLNAFQSFVKNCMDFQ